MQEVLIVAGEASADIHGAHLVRELRPLLPSVKFFGVGGRELASEGVEITVPAESLNVVGVADWFDKVSTVLGAYRALKREIDRRKPVLAILLDLPDFNLRLSKKLKRMEIPTVYYISPQIWAWRRYRVHTIARNITRMLVVFPFEKEFYDSHGVEASFVGHPLLDQIRPRSEFRTDAEVERAPRVALLPGSRPSELRHHADLVREVAQGLRLKYPKCEIRVPVASTLPASEVISLFPSDVRVVEGDSRETLAWADFAVVASGTATLETAIIGTPFCLFYRMSPSTSWVVQHLVRYRRYFGMPNLLHGREVAKEFLHSQATAEAILGECGRLIQDGQYRRQVARDLRHCASLLGQPGASHRAAREVCDVLKVREGAVVASPA